MNKDHYSQPVPSNMQPQRQGTPRNVGSPPPDAPPERYSGRTQMGKQGGYTPQPGARPGERPQGTAAKPQTMGDRPTGTAVPERRSAKADMGGVPGSVGFDISVPDDAFNIQKPSRTDGYKPPGKPERGGP